MEHPDCSCRLTARSWCLLQSTQKGRRHGVAVRLPAAGAFELVLFGRSLPHRETATASSSADGGGGGEMLSRLATFRVTGVTGLVTGVPFPKSFPAFRRQGAGLL